MIPLRLTLKNFLSYGAHEQMVNFEPYPLICFSGKNGHGKSALLDAITWATWGQARKVSGATKADADILHIGQTFMTVIFDFSMNGHTYRIKREYGKTYAKPYASLDFGIFESQNNIRSLTEKTIRATQEKIEHTIGLDYESFVNTAFLRQGNANEFSRKSPKDRKDILATILGLHQYENLKKQAQEKAREAATQRNHIADMQTQLTAQLDQLSAVPEVLQNLQQDLATLVHEEKQLFKEQQKGNLLYENVSQQIQALQLIQFQYHQRTLELTKGKETIRSLYTQWRSVNRHLSTAPDRAVLEQEKHHIIQKLQQQQESLQHHLVIKEQYLKAKEEEQTHKTSLQKQYQQKIHQQTIIIEQLSSDIKAHVSQLTHYRAAQEQLTAECTALEQQKKILEQKKNGFSLEHAHALEKKFEKGKEYYHRWTAQLHHSNLEQQQLVQKQLLTQDSENPSCPLCEQNLSASRKKFLKTQFARQAQLQGHRKERLEKITQQLKESLIAQHQQFKQCQQAKESVQIIQVQLEEYQKSYEKKLIQKQEYTQQLEKVSNMLSIFETTMRDNQMTLKQLQESELEIYQNEQYQKIHTQKNELEALLQQQAYIPEQHQVIMQALTSIEKKLQEHDQLIQEKNNQAYRKEEIHQLCSSLKVIKKEIIDLQAQCYSLATLEVTKKTVQEKHQQLVTKLQEIQQRKEQLLQQKGGLEQQIVHIEQQKKQLTQHSLTIGQREQDVYDYTAIATALSKNGIQALLIEDAIPDIEHEANVLLGLLTDNQTHIMIESLRDLKSGGTKETLDINISDPVGIRPYELFSGGEAFRIDFALRIAISRLLARRAGTSLQTLIIDEGFGSQDEEGLSRLMDCLHKIQDNFSKIIVVSHLPALKDQFPVHFAISKGPQGSAVNVIEYA